MSTDVCASQMLIITVYTDNASLKNDNYSKNHLRMKDWHTTAFYYQFTFMLFRITTNML